MKQSECLTAGLRAVGRLTLLTQIDSSWHMMAATALGGAWVEALYLLVDAAVQGLKLCTSMAITLQSRNCVAGG